MMDFNEAYIRLRERLYQYQEMRREMGPGADVPDEPLPAYEASSAEAAPTTTSTENRPNRSESTASRGAPEEPPPGYDEAQAQQLNIRLEDHVRGEIDRGAYENDD
jgi:hypothetical protein